jgi:hypothetical protein
MLLTTLAVGQGYKPKEGYVPNSETAVKIAEAVLIPVYGKKQIGSEEPFTARLKDGVWTVQGSLHCPDGSTTCVGGVAEVKISKDDARDASNCMFRGSGLFLDETKMMYAAFY